jgi:transcriptional regulator with XRE-family HTH domain
VLAGLVGRSEDWLSKVERNERQIRRLDVLTEVARALRVTIGDLLGQAPFARADERNEDLAAVRDALMAPRQLSRVLFKRSADSPPAHPETAASLIEGGWADYQTGRVSKVLAKLPSLIHTAQHLEDTSAGQSSDIRRRCLAGSARVHHLATTSLIRVGQVELAWIAAERAMQAADRSDDPLVLASAARAGTHALLAVGRYGDALDLGTAATRWLQPRLATNDPTALSLYGMLHLRTAVAAGLRQDRSLATESLFQASHAAQRLGRDANYWHTGFGPTNVEFHRVSVALELGDVAYAGEHGQHISAEHMPPERRASLLIDVARALSLRARDEQALTQLLEAEQVAPQLVHHNPAVRDTVRDLHRRAPASAGRSSVLFGLTERCGAMR